MWRAVTRIFDVGITIVDRYHYYFCDTVYIIYYTILIRYYSSGVVIKKNELLFITPCHS